MIAEYFGIDYNTYYNTEKSQNMSGGEEMIIRNVKVYGEDKCFTNGEIIIRNGVFAEGEGDSGEEIDGGGCYAIPGLVDLHFHGCVGYDFCDGTKEAIQEIAKYEASVGVTAIAPATMTLPAEELVRVLSAAAEYNKEGHAGADLIGINMEGPFISEEKKGAQDARHIISCDENVCEKFLRASDGLVKFVGIAPEKNEMRKNLSGG